MSRLRLYGLEDAITKAHLGLKASLLGDRLHLAFQSRLKNMPSTLMYQTFTWRRTCIRCARHPEGEREGVHELVALVAVSCTLFLFLHTRDLSTKLRRMQGRLNDDVTAFNHLTDSEYLTTSI
ncbi:unnamed protein product [Chilo suppressalis]|uniref:Uncharacterized protein n=1 Tax=Chilo suppressalis TaxID=168631 RepID=A0ABN8AZ86_CHISP|nr:unnamed protein product [Chilo suppressalis]